MKNLVQIRVSRGLSQENLSKLSGLSQPTISQIEQGKSYPQAKTRYKLEEVLGPIDWMATKLHGNHQIELAAGPESRVLKEIEQFVAADQIKGYEFLENYISRKLFKLRLIEKAYKHMAGNKQTFTAEETDFIKNAPIQAFI